MKTAELTEKLASLTPFWLGMFLEEVGATSEDLDETVHDAKSEEASSINNGGLRSQLEYLVPAGSPRDKDKGVLDILSDLALQKGSDVAEAALQKVKEEVIRRGRPEW